jgi:predicted DNA-binding protein
MTDEMNERKQIIVRVPPELHKRAKVLSAQTGKPLQQVLEELLREWTAKQEAQQKQKK